MNIITLLIILLFIPNVEHRTSNIEHFLSNIEHRTFYIDNVSGNDLNNGQNPSKAWKSIAKVNSFTFHPGDKILFKRSNTWFEQLNLKGNGTNASGILISDYGSGNLPIIDGGLKRTQCIFLENNKYITVSNLQMQNATRQGAIRIKRGNNIVVENCKFLVTGHGGVFIENSSNCIIRNNDITTASGVHNNQTDGIFSQRNNNVTFDNNTIIISNEHSEQHCDGIQSYMDMNLTVSNNYVEQRNNKSSNAQGIYATTMLGKHTYYNNVVYCPNTKASVMGFRNLKEGRGYLAAYHNTLVGGGSNILFVSENAGVDAKNNIFYSTGKSSPLRLETSDFKLSNNLYYSGGSEKIIYFGKNSKIRNILDVKREGFDLNGIFAEPKLTNEFKPMQNSPAIDNAVVLGAPYNRDKEGKKRPSGNAPDIGAYEYLK